ncbi:hypothetical protein [Nocardia jiangxiensis]|uniref:hypothetical protein n=1 Tax=Nocardia jiangxiensis TaxID=282685 RepID=UPI000594E0D3|nr:hypothetical protein [Nocardia jiangxiensis]
MNSDLRNILLSAHEQGLDIWPIINDVTDSFRLAMRNAGVDSEVIKSVMTTVTDYTANHYGD